MQKVSQSSFKIDSELHNKGADQNKCLRWEDIFIYEMKAGV